MDVIINSTNMNMMIMIIITNVNVRFDGEKKSFISFQYQDHSDFQYTINDSMMMINKEIQNSSILYNRMGIGKEKKRI